MPTVHSYLHPFRWTVACVLALLLWCAAPVRLSAQAGSLDTGFNPDIDNIILGVARQADGQFVIGGEFTTINGAAHDDIARLAPDGSVDASFNPSTDGEVFAVALQTDGKIVFAGPFTLVNGVARNGVARLNTDGTLDASFDPGVGPNATINSLALQADGKVVVAGDFTSFDGVSRSRVAELNSDGTLYTGFDPGAGPNNSARSLAVQPDGKVLLGGFFYTVNGVSRKRLARFNTDGSLDTAFDPGTGASSTVRAFAIQPDRKIVIGGEMGTYNGVSRRGIARLNANGSLDTSFDPGTGALDVYALAIQPDGKIIIGGTFTTVNGVTRNRIARLNASGSLDASFDPGTGADNLPRSIVQQPDGKIVLGGSFATINGLSHTYLARLNNDPRGTLQFNPASYSAAESLGGVSLTVTRTGGSAGAVSVNYSTANGSAQAGSDYAATGGTLSWADGDATPKAITVPIINDNTPKSGQMFAVVLGGPTGGAALGTPAQSGVTILDDDVPTNPGVPAPVVTSSATASALVGASFSFAITATNSPTSFAAVGLPPGLDLNAQTGLISGTPTAAGTFTVGVGATNAGGTGTASLIVTVTVPPANITAVNILSPPTNIAIVAGETIDLQVAVEAVNGTLSTVEFDVTDAGGTKTYLGNSTAPRDHKTWNPVALGDFTLSATATETTGKTARSEIPIHVVAGTNPPVSQLLSGLNDKTFAAGSTLPLVALATDASGNALSNVQFYLDGVLVPGVSTAAAHRQDAAASPYTKASAKLGNLIGDALLTMTGTDDRGITSVSDPATVHIKAATAMFTCAITSPEGGGTYAPGASVTVTASAVETGGSVAQIEYFLNDQSLGVATGAPFTRSFPLPATVGPYALTAIATDTQGVSAASSSVILSAVETLLPPPVVTITGNASVAEGSNAKLIIRRDGTSQAVTVRYKLAGAARAGTDYKALSGSVVIPAGASTAKLKLKTIDNPTPDGTRIVKVKLLPSTDSTYTLGAPATAKLKITDND